MTVARNRRLHTGAERAVTGNLLFDTLTAPARRAIINSMSPQSVPPGTAIIRQGDRDATRFYVLASGQATVHVANADTGASKHIATLRPGQALTASLPPPPCLAVEEMLCASCMIVALHAAATRRRAARPARATHSRRSQVIAVLTADDCRPHALEHPEAVHARPWLDPPDTPARPSHEACCSDAAASASWRCCTMRRGPRPSRRRRSASCG